jgi:acyl carrier protein
MDDVESRVKAVIAAVLKVNESTIKSTDAFVQDLGASSIQSIELVAGFEEEFGIEMDEDEALSVKNVGDAVDYIRKIVG